MAKRVFNIHLDGDFTVEVDQQVIDMVDGEWRETFYDLLTPEEIALHLGMNLIVGTKMSNMDGWASLEDDTARTIPASLNDIDWDVSEAHEVQLIDPNVDKRKYYGTLP